MNTLTTHISGILVRWRHVLGAMLMAALMVSSVAISQRSSEKTPRKTPKVTLAPVNLGTAGDFVILAKSGISTTGNTRITGDIGVSPIGYAAITGFTLIPTVPNGSNTFATSSLVTGKVYAADYSAPTPVKMTTAVGDMETAYTNAAGRTPPDYTELYSGDVTGRTLTQGLYKWSTGVLVSAGGVIISGSATDVWIFQIAENLTVANGAIVTLIGGAQACNIFWQVAGQTTIGTTAAMKGIILSQTLIAMNTGATLNGRALAQTAVTLIADTVTPPQCSASACPNNVPPVFVSPTPTCGTIFNVTAGTPVSFTVQASDVDPGPVQLNVTGLPVGATMTPVLPTNGNPVQSTFSWTPTNSQTGSTVVTFAALDTCGGLAQCSFTLNVAPALPCLGNVPPVFVSPTPTCGTIFNVAVGTPVSFTVKASDVDPGPVQLSVTGLPVGATMTPVLPTNGNPVQSTFSWTPTSGQTGSTVVTFTALDTCGGLAQCSFTFIVTCADNTPPSCIITATIPGPPQAIQVTVRDLQSGLASVVVLTSTNANTVVPAFTVGTTSPLVITATKINQSLSTTVQLRVTDVCGNSIVCDPVYTTISAEVPQEFALGANYPNPFNPSTRIEFNISKPEGSVSLKVFDVVGREVKTLISESMQPGQYFVEWDGTNNQGIAVTSGVYIYRMVAGNFIATRRMTLMK